MKKIFLFIFVIVYNLNSMETDIVYAEQLVKESNPDAFGYLSKMYFIHKSDKNDKKLLEIVTLLLKMNHLSKDFLIKEAVNHIRTLSESGDKGAIFFLKNNSLLDDSKK